MEEKNLKLTQSISKMIECIRALDHIYCDVYEILASQLGEDETAILMAKEFLPDHEKLSEDVYTLINATIKENVIQM